MEYLFQGKLDNTVHDISYDQLKLLYEDNLREAEESKKITESSYRGENFYTPNGNLNYELTKEYLYRDPKTAGMRMYYPHGIVIEQSSRRNIYRGENQVFESSIPSLLRTLKTYSSKEDQELYRMVADMRIAEFSYMLQKFRHVQEWRDSDVLYEPLAQHYGLETCWLDMTSDFSVALFFATCYWDGNKWLPLTRAQTETDDVHRYGMIYHIPSSMAFSRWGMAIQNMNPWTDAPVEDDGKGHVRYGKLEYPVYRNEQDNIIYPIGFQPFMRCHMQHGYGIYMRNPKPLQLDIGFEKLRFRHSEELSNTVYNMMHGGDLVYPHEGLRQVQFLIDQIRDATSFSEEAFQYALYRSHLFRLRDADAVREKMCRFTVGEKNIEITQTHPWKLSSGRRKKIDALYSDFSIQDRYGIMIMERKQIPGPQPLFEPWMMPDKEDGEGVKDFRLRDGVDCGTSITTRNYFSDLYALMNKRLSDF